MPREKPLIERIPSAGRLLIRIGQANTVQEEGMVAMPAAQWEAILEEAMSLAKELEVRILTAQEAERFLATKQKSIADRLLSGETIMWDLPDLRRN